MRRFPLTAALAAAAIITTGCGSLVTRIEHDFTGSPLGVYPGVRGDARFAVSPARRNPNQWPGVFVTAPLAVADMPLSAIVDTCALASDLKR
jgi:uncharacterized protein YceK